MQSGERQLHLGLDAGDPGDAKSGCLSSAVVQEGRLADARLAADDQNRALAATDVVQQAVERLALAGSAQQHRRAAVGHCSPKPKRPGTGPREHPGATARDRGHSFCVSRTDPVAVVTGGSSPTGREIARELAGRGYAVVVVYLRDRGEAESAVEEILAANGTALVVRADVTDELDVSTSDAITAVLADALRARDITVNGVAPGLEPPGAAHDIADLVALLDRWRRSPGE
jgi:hypothetical protein